MKKMTRVLGILLIFLSLSTAGFSDEKNWTAKGDKSSWTDDDNWYPAAAPTASDVAIVDILDSSADISQTFHVKSVTLAGKKTSAITVENFTDGDVIPADAADDAIHNRKSGLLLMKGSAGTVTLKGVYRSSRETVPEEASFMSYAQ